jgi:hypothetical protein
MLAPFMYPERTVVPLPGQFRCPVCHADVATKAFTRHLTRCLDAHHISVAEYERRYPRALYGPVHQFAMTWMRLARFSRHQFGLMDYAGCDWCHVDAHQQKPSYYCTIGIGDKERTFRRPETLPLVLYREARTDWRSSFHHFAQHLRGKLTLGIWPDLDNSFLMLDVDQFDGPVLPALLERLLDLRLHFYVNFSGKKGYHVWIFFNEVVENARLVALHKYLCDGLEVDRRVWPFMPKLIKLPLGLHRQTERLAAFVDYTRRAIPLVDQFACCLGMKQNTFPEIELADYLPQGHDPIPMPSGPKRIASQKPNGNESSSPEWQVSDAECEEMLAGGSRPEHLSRYFLLFRLAAYLKNIRDLDRASCKSILIGWSRQVSSTADHILCYDVRRQVDSVFDKKVSGGGSTGELSDAQKAILAAHIDEILQGRGTHSRPLDRRQHAQAYASMLKIAEYLARLIIWHDGECHVAFTTIAARTGLTGHRIDKWLPLLCGDDPDLADAEGGRSYSGTLFRRLGRATYHGHLSQEYGVSPAIAKQLGVAKMAVSAA